MNGCSIPHSSGVPILCRTQSVVNYSTGDNVQSDGISGIMTLSDAAKTMPRINGRKVHTSTLWRWCRRGCKGVRLQYFRIGRTIMVSDATLNQFFTSLAEADPAQTAPHFKQRKRRPRSNDRQASIDAANAVLRNAGILV